MAVTNYNKRCTSCGGNRWEYVKDLKMWRCLYCDAQVERQEQYDGLYTIKNVVRQVILDAAYRRMEQADRNLSECQKINARYPGTLIAGICYRMIAAVSGMIPAGQDPRSMLDQLKRDYRTLTEETRDMSDDETALYEFLDSDDAWAVLATIFDTLGDQQRRDYLLTLFDPMQVFSAETNKSLLRFALKNNRIELAEKVLSHPEHVDLGDSLSTTLSTCPDCEAKARMAVTLLQHGALKAGEEAMLENYLSGPDSAQTKAAIASAACQAGLTIRFVVLAEDVLPHAALADFQQLLSSLFQRRLYDGEIEQLLNLAATLGDAERSMVILDAIAASGQFVALNARQAQEFVFSTSVPATQRASILEKLRSFGSSDRIWETVTGAYLCQVADSQEDRAIMLDALCKDLISVPAKDFEQYVLTSTIDGESKPQRIKQILSLPGMNSGFFRDLAGKYLMNNHDDPQNKDNVLRQLQECGLAVDSSVLLDYVCPAPILPHEKAESVPRALQSGTALRADALSLYLEKCPRDFSSELFGALYMESSSISAKALENYVLICRDDPSVKVQNANALAYHTGIGLGSTNCSIYHNGSRISCTLAQAYILKTEDDLPLASQMVRCMTDNGAKLAAPIQVDGLQKKFSKYVQEKRTQLSSVSEQICQDNRLFSWFA